MPDGRSRTRRGGEEGVHARLRMRRGNRGEVDEGCERWFQKWMVGRDGGPRNGSDDGIMEERGWAVGEEQEESITELLEDICGALGRLGRKDEGKSSEEGANTV